MKSYTDILQSHKLSEILPPESADMFYSDVPVREWIDRTDISKGTHVVFKSQIFAIENIPNHEIGEGDVYAWSLAALINVLHNTKLCHYNDSYFCQYIGIGDEFPIYSTAEYNNPVDACYELILKLHA